jgi:hypothetical protein
LAACPSSLVKILNKDPNLISEGSLKTYIHLIAHFFSPNQVIHKDRKRRHQNPLFGHIGDEISKNRKKNKVHWASTGQKLNLVCSKFSAKLSLPSPFFPERLQPFTSAMRTVAINVLKCRAFNLESQYLIKFHDFVDNSHEGMKHHQMRGCNSGPTEHDFTDNSHL